jgi:CRISPR/Cas system CSM-associated protein Csm4 (group 5 of RAMP superfamily)
VDTNEPLSSDQAKSPRNRHSTTAEQEWEENGSKKKKKVKFVQIAPLLGGYASALNSKKVSTHLVNEMDSQKVPSELKNEHRIKEFMARLIPEHESVHISSPGLASPAFSSTLQHQRESDALNLIAHASSIAYVE